MATSTSTTGFSSGGSGSSNGAQFFNTTTVSRLQDELRASKEELAQVSAQLQQLGSRKWELEKRVDDIKSELNLLNENESSVSKYHRNDFPWSEELNFKLHSVFGIQDFRSHQKSAINATMSGVDLILVMPTGGGKSLCFQLPAILSSGVTVVISPLISLMQDQLQGLKSLGIETEILNSSSDRAESKRIFGLMEDPSSTMKLLYLTPEKLAKNKLLMPQLEKMYRGGRFARLVIDEVHCCSQWGHEFRPDYKFLGIMKTQYPKTPIIGLTATVTASVLVDIQKILNIEGCLVLRDSFYRPNLRYSVLDSSPKGKIQDVAALIKSQFVGQSGIIYCLTVKDCEDVAKQLNEDYAIPCASYHARLDPDARTDTQNRWSQDDIQVIVATVAFGMGINKLNVRFVIHYSLSKSVENYYQETGRAGRDGLDAECILFYSFPDAFVASSMMMTERNGSKNVYNMLNYTLDQVSCRKRCIAVHFGDPCEAIENGCNKCDNCEFASAGVNPRKEIKVNATKMMSDILKILDHASSLETRMTTLKLMDSWFNKGQPKLRTSAVQVPEIGREICEKLVARLIVDRFLKEDFHFTPYSTIGYIVAGSKAILNLPKCLEYTFYEARQKKPPAETPTKKVARNGNSSSRKNSTPINKSNNKRKSRSSSDESEDEEMVSPPPPRKSTGRKKVIVEEIQIDSDTDTE